MSEINNDVKKRTNWRTRLANWVVNFTSIPDKIAIKRAKDIVEKSKIRDHLKENGTYLDIGTGLGHIVEEVVKEEDDKNVKFLALDPTWKPLKRLKKRAKKEYSDKALFMKAEGEHLPVRPHSLDGISLFFIMHHILPEDQLKVMDEIKLALKDDGLLFVTEDVPEDEEEAERNAQWDARLNFESKDEQHFYKTNKDWIDFFNKHGFELVENVYWDENSKKKKEGLIRHRNYILRKKSEIQDITKESKESAMRMLN